MSGSRRGPGQSHHRAIPTRSRTAAVLRQHTVGQQPSRIDGVERHLRPVRPIDNQAHTICASEDASGPSCSIALSTGTYAVRAGHRPPHPVVTASIAMSAGLIAPGRIKGHLLSTRNRGERPPASRVNERSRSRAGWPPGPQPLRPRSPSLQRAAAIPAAQSWVDLVHHVRDAHVTRKGRRAIDSTAARTAARSRVTAGGSLAGRSPWPP